MVKVVGVLLGLLAFLVSTYAYLFLFMWLIHDGKPNLYDGWVRILVPFLKGYRTAVASTPFVQIPDSLVLKCVWNSGLVLFFGCCHSLFSREYTRHFFVKTLGIVPVYLYRTLFMVVTTAAFGNVTANWNYTNVVLFSFRPIFYSLGATDAGMDQWEPFFRFVLHLICLSTVVKLDIWTFIGVRQAATLKDEDTQRAMDSAEEAAAAAADGTSPPKPFDNPELKTTGMYGVVRHPMYFWLISIVWTATVFTLDRLVLLGSMVLYLTVALPWEEAKLVNQFGPAYERYQKTVPMLFPFMPMPGVSASKQD